MSHFRSAGAGSSILRLLICIGLVPWWLVFPKAGAQAGCFTGTCFKLSQFGCNVCVDGLVPAGMEDCINWVPATYSTCLGYPCEDECECHAINVLQNTFLRPCDCTTGATCKDAWQVDSQVECAEIQACDVECTLLSSYVCTSTTGTWTSWTCAQYKLDENADACTADPPGG